MKNSMSFHASRQNGATLVEILIAILVFSIGLLGIASTQTMGMTNSQSAMNKSYAVQYAYELVDIIRANQVEATSAGSAFNNFEFYSTDAATGRVVALDPALNTDGDCFTAATGCTENALAQQELTNWQRKVSTLPDGQASLRQVNANENTYRVVITWRDVKALEQAQGRQDEVDALDGVDPNFELENYQSVFAVLTNSPDPTLDVFRFELEFRP